MTIHEFGAENKNVIQRYAGRECSYWIPGDKDPDALADAGSK